MVLHKGDRLHESNRLDARAAGAGLRGTVDCWLCGGMTCAERWKVRLKYETDMERMAA